MTPKAGEFLWGAASAAYQVEGGWDKDGRGLSKWDIYTNEWHITVPQIGKNQTGNVAINAYDRDQYLNDIALLKELGVNAYRFSISWPRVLPAGHRRRQPARPRLLFPPRRRSARRRHQAGRHPLSLGFPLGAAPEGRLPQSRRRRLVHRLCRHRLQGARRSRRHLHHHERAVHRRHDDGPDRRERPCRPYARARHRRAVWPPGSGAPQSLRRRRFRRPPSTAAQGLQGHGRPRRAAVAGQRATIPTMPPTSPPPPTGSASSTAGRSMSRSRASTRPTCWRR